MRGRLAAVESLLSQPPSLASRVDCSRLPPSCRTTQGTRMRPICVILLALGLALGCVGGGRSERAGGQRLPPPAQHVVLHAASGRHPHRHATPGPCSTDARKLLTGAGSDVEAKGEPAQPAGPLGTLLRRQGRGQGALLPSALRAGMAGLPKGRTLCTHHTARRHSGWRPGQHEHAGHHRHRRDVCSPADALCCLAACPLAAPWLPASLPPALLGGEGCPPPDQLPGLPTLPPSLPASAAASLWAPSLPTPPAPRRPPPRSSRPARAAAPAPPSSWDPRPPPRPAACGPSTSRLEAPTPPRAALPGAAASPLAPSWAPAR